MSPFLKRVGLAFYPRPRGLSALGAGSVLMFPRRVHGAAHIEIGADVIVNAHGWIAAFPSWGDQRFSPHIRIGDHCRIGRHVMITAIEQVSIGEGCLFSEHVFVSDHTHQALPGPTPPTHQPLVPRGAVSIGRHCFIGIRACIMGGVTIGDYCVVGANSVVTRSFPPGSVIGGIPARLIKSLRMPDAHKSTVPPPSSEESAHV